MSRKPPGRFSVRMKRRISPHSVVVGALTSIATGLYQRRITTRWKLVPFGRRGRVVCTLPGDQMLDSLAVEANGYVCGATLLNGGIAVFKPDGTFEHVPLPDPMTTNICFGGADMRDAFITLSGTGRLIKARWPRDGLRLNFQQSA